MSAPYVAATPVPATEQHVHQQPPPPEESPLVADVAAVLLAGLAIWATAEGIEVLLRPFGIGVQAIMAAVGLANTTSHNPRAELRVMGIEPSSPAAEVSREAARSELFYRAAYVVAAARRVQEAMNNGGTLRAVMAAEARHTKQHRAARRNRLDAAGAVARAVEIHGPLLGWYIDPVLNNEAECIAANGHNFYATQGTVIGLPGSVHPNCGCTPGPPHIGASTVNDALRHVIRHIPAGRVLKLKHVRAAS